MGDTSEELENAGADPMSPRLFSRCWRWLLTGSSDQWMSRYWLANQERLAAYAEWTERQREGRIEKDTAWFRRQAFWEAQAEKSEARRLKVVGGRFQ